MGEKVVVLGGKYDLGYDLYRSEPVSSAKADEIIENFKKKDESWAFLVKVQTPCADLLSHHEMFILSW